MKEPVGLIMMLEHFGLKDILIVCKKYVVLILSFVFLAICIFGTITFKNVQSISLPQKSVGANIYTAVASYCIKIDESKLAEINDFADYLKSLTKSCVDILNGSVCSEYIYNSLKKKYTTDEIAGLSEFAKSKRKGEKFIPIDAMNKVYLVKDRECSMVFDIYGVGYTKKFAEDVLDACVSFIDCELSDSKFDFKLESFGKTIRTIESFSQINTASEDESSSFVNSATNVEVSKKSILAVVVKSGILPVLGLAILLVFVLALKDFFDPTLNRKSDFCEYEIPVIGEIIEK